VLGKGVRKQPVSEIDADVDDAAVESR